MINITDHSFTLSRLKREAERSSQELHQEGKHKAAASMEEYTQAIEDSISKLQQSQE